jgi:glutathione S-transferase
MDILDNTLAKQRWLSGDAFGCGDIAVGPFIYNLFAIPGLSWTPRANLQRWYEQLCERPGFRSTVMIPVT